MGKFFTKVCLPIDKDFSMRDGKVAHQLQPKACVMSMCCGVL